ncbi:MAG: hypothetical protein ABJ308_03745 [Halieaceae bacterium]
MSSTALSFPGVCLACITALSAVTGLAEEPTGGGQESPAPQTWIDGQHQAISQRADGLARWTDSFFGDANSVEDSPSSLIRIRPQYNWDEQDDDEWSLRATGRLYLPVANDRLSLVFLGEDEDFDDDFYDPGLVADGESTLDLQYQLRDKLYHKAYLIAGFKAGPKGKLGAKYRYQRQLQEKTLFRFSEELFWVGGDGFGTLTRADLDYRLGQETLLRWANRAEYSEESNGVEWNSRLAWVWRLDEQSALRAFTFIRGETDPELLKSRGFGLGYRRQFLRDWLFWEVEPRYAWRKRQRDPDREGVAMIKLRLEILIGGH